MNANTRVAEVVSYPEFAPFGRLLFPSGYRGPDSGMTLAGIAPLLPWHSFINVGTTLDVLGYMRDTVRGGGKLFYDIYSRSEMESCPGKRDTGLFFFKGKPGAPFAIVCAGGGFVYVGSIHESFPHALHLSRRGLNAFALHYRTDSANAACEDLARAIGFIFAHAGEFGTATSGYSLWGGSAGARMAAYLGSYGPAAFGGPELPGPAAVIMQYTGHSDCTAGDPPTYACVGERDYIANWRVMARRIERLDAMGIPTEFHLFRSLPHGFGLGLGTAAEGWIDGAADFWLANISAPEG